ncbi:MAG: S-adenosylmethionine synthase [Candidatus Shapirobacteria bacterium GW2011_GWF1_38_23]|nr:MAG: S-adenosylmethionine synthase [Candidatus Shapirobacteria bacterium GW2011_GWF1_38_23]
MNYSQFSSESVSAGHPDKICDQISDAVLDEAIRLDKKSRVAVETLVTTNKIVMAGEVTCKQKIDFEGVARKMINEIGYDKKYLNFGDYSPVEVYIHQQSADIALGVDNEGAGDQGMMFGYASDETSELMPLPIVLAHKLCKKMDELEIKEDWIRPDGKSQVTVSYRKGKVVGVDKVVLAKPLDYEKIGIDKVIFNGTGRWERGGPSTDSGVTGRKIVVDTYGGMGRIGGGCFSGKDPTKVDRSGAYAARYLAKNVVAKGLAKRCEVQLAYAIGVRDPVSKSIDTFGSEVEDLKTINNFVWNLMDLSVQGIFDLQRPIFTQTAKYGHFGNAKYPWEQIEK